MTTQPQAAVAATDIAADTVQTQTSTEQGLGSPLNRRQALLAAGLGAGALTLAACGSSSTPAAASSTSTSAPAAVATSTSAPAAVATSTSAPAAAASGGAAAAGGTLVALSKVPVGGAVAAKDASGKPVIIAQPTAGAAVAFSGSCTHKGCPVAVAGAELHCPCHGSKFNALTGAVLHGPAAKPLPPIVVKVKDGNVVSA